MNSTTASKESRIRSGPRALKKKGSYEWAVQMREHLKTLWKDFDLDIRRWEKQLVEAEDGKLWKPLGYQNLDAVLKEEVGCGTKKESIHLLTHGGDRRSERVRKNQSDNITLKYRGTSASYLLARLARDRPDILSDWERGAFPSVRAAAIAAGIVRVPTPLEAAQRAFRRLGTGDRDEFRKWLGEDLDT